MLLKHQGLGVGGDAAPPLSNKMIRTIFFCCTHGDGMMLFIGYMDAFETAGGWEVGGDAAPLFSNKMIRTTFLSCKHVDDMMFLIGSMDCFKTVWAGGGGLRPPHWQTT